MKRMLILLLFFCNALIARAQRIIEPSAAKHPEWTRSFPPFQIAGNLYYVGTADLACYLITTSGGNILINTGLASSEQQITTNIKTLGFRISDTKILLTTQAHFDHMGAMAAIKKITKAKMMVDEGDATVVADGGLSDYDLKGGVRTFKPVKADRILHNGDSIKLGNMKLTILHHPGHTKGSCSYLFDVKDNKRNYRVLIANMPTIVTDKKFSDISSYPGIANDYAYTLKAMKGLKFDIWLASHGSQFDLLSKHKPGSPYNPMVFADKKNYYDEINELQEEYDKKIAEK
ncbi:subclass B3 metallo-beta-lactamase [Mucilaginibacter rubeus]|uniref:Subclass B3 metallo-beta-lactamase n=1 Tax=Mucilaginibacter rubeus TaxID=2027860 RepID=A0AAE6JBL2_9SPHI|nr:subclass B3 metallo-beta-lactamase [Mucilaginibacter rubeus]QEM02669.1 subclass B3 metallo-beta-lactamase [Mucilaginibacter rubeus]QTE41982.1 subclass B3 metallo-beta-lactamase [Mucilaginibacter rubeus]QTE48583.1 subclass B3 metallo-beta-lactamase [Mucilaginibacter rubeus]QTE59970.1 subclass B3 metallo-beta-lactamase [Mucilaginibacter rubeus]QTE60564.1 subclass B3 metallo-beta-lactamase [Mucilaginibacter rubeus]